MKSFSQSILDSPIGSVGGPRTWGLLDADATGLASVADPCLP